MGCGILVHTKDGKVVNTEGDPDHPINEGTLCSKGASLYQIINNPQRLTKPKYRAPGATEWKEVEWDWALDEIAKRVKDTRDKTFKTHLQIESERKSSLTALKRRWKRSLWSTGPTALPMSEARPWTTKSATCSRSCCGPGVWSI